MTFSQPLMKHGTISSTTLRVFCAIFAISTSAVATQESEDSPFHPLEGKTEIGGGMATIDLPDGWVYIADAEARLLVEQWGNPLDRSVIGVILPPEDQGGDDWSVIVSFSDDGYIEDEDAADIDYSELLESMQAGEDENNRARREAGYSGI
ncbi:MAG: DUF2167 domain-containing protein [bacterium]|nr:DUF2167 domain-containing protein [bacterium]